MRDDQSKRFCHCIDSLTLFANKKFRIHDEMFKPNSNFIDQEKRHEVLDKLFFEQREIIDEYIKKNEEDLLKSTLNEIKNWKHAISDYFLVAQVKEDYAIFSTGDYSFKVVGITQNINEICPKAPTWVSAILLPFEGVITYAMSIAELCLSFGENAAEALSDDVKDALSKDIIEDAQDFIELAPKINQEIKDRKERAKKDSLFDENNPGKMKTSYVPPSKGKHEGKLKGIKGKKRNALIFSKDYVKNDSLDDEFRSLSVASAKKHSFKFKPREKYSDFVKDCLHGDNPYGETNIKDLTDVCPDYFIYSDDGQSELAQKLIKNNYVWVVDENSKDYKLLNADYLAPYGALFYYQKKFTWVIFEEFRHIISDIDWDAVQEVKDINWKIVDMCNKLAEMCGIVDMRDVYSQFKDWYGDYDSYDGNVSDFCEYIELLSNHYELQCDFIVTEPADSYSFPVILNKTLLLDYDLYGPYIDDDSEELRERVQAFDEEVIMLMEHQSKFKFKLLPESLKHMDVFDYYLEIPELNEFLEFFDERVPDNDNDYAYADRVFEGFIDTQRYGSIGASNINDLIDRFDLDFNDEELQEFLNRFMNAANALPRWDNYGHSPASLRNSEFKKNPDFSSKNRYSIETIPISTSKKVDKNGSFTLETYPETSIPITTSKKVGRNDPCPCGSGKKYKKCCGRRF